MTTRVCVTGCAGFIGHHLARYLKSLGYWVRGVDLRYSPYTVRLDAQLIQDAIDQSEADADNRGLIRYMQPVIATTLKPDARPADDVDEFLILDLRRPDAAYTAVHDMDCIYHLAADMGGMAFITTQRSNIILNNTRINVNVLNAAILANVPHLFFSSSVCVYPTTTLSTTHPTPLVESDVYPAYPQESYGWEKLHMEHMCKCVQSSSLLNIYIARFHNVYGPECEWRPDSHRAKAPAELARKVAIAKFTGDPEVEIWGDGQATRSFMYITDCIRGIHTLTESGYHLPVTLGPDRIISINALVDLLADIAGTVIVKKHIEGPEGVRGRAFDHTRARALGWQPQVSFEDGMSEMYHWVEEQVKESLTS